VVWHQAPGLPTCLVLTHESCQASREKFPILITEKDLLPGNSTPDGMMQGPWGMYPTL
jgi:hypothetical protein